MTRAAKECPEEKSWWLPYEAVGFAIQKGNGETGEGPGEACQDGVRSLKQEL